MAHVLRKESSSLLVIKAITFIILLIISFDSNGQNKISYDSIKDNSKGITLVDFKKWSYQNQAVIFFCPVGDDYKDSSYIKQSLVYKNDKRFSEYKGNIRFIFYKENNNNSKNPFLLNTYKSNDSILNQLQCFIFLESDKNIVRAQKKLSEKFNFKKDKNNSNLYRIDITDFACPKDLPSKTAFYLDIINEIFVPIYSTDEKIELLEFRIKNLEQEIIILKNQNSTNKIENHQQNQKTENNNSDNNSKKWDLNQE